MTEPEWVQSIGKALRRELPAGAPLRIETGLKLAYGYEIGSYPEAAKARPTARVSKFQTDLAIDGHRMSQGERRTFGEILKAEIEASRYPEKLLYQSRRRTRDRYTVLHRKLIVK